MNSTETRLCRIAAYVICIGGTFEKSAAVIRNSNTMFLSKCLLLKTDTVLTTAAPPFMWLILDFPIEYYTPNYLNTQSYILQFPNYLREFCTHDILLPYRQYTVRKYVHPECPS